MIGYWTLWMIHYKVSRFCCVPIKSDFCSSRHSTWLDPSSNSVALVVGSSCNLCFFQPPDDAFVPGQLSSPSYMQSLAISQRFSWITPKFFVPQFFFGISSQRFWLLSQTSELHYSPKQEKIRSACRRKAVSLTDVDHCGCLPRVEVSTLGSAHVLTRNDPNS